MKGRMRWSQPVLRRPTVMFAGGILGGHGATEIARNVVQDYLDLLDSQREAVFASLDGLSDEQIWHRPAPREWCVGETVSHTLRFFAGFLPGVVGMWALCGWHGRLRRNRPYRVEIENAYERPGFPMWSGFLWAPRHNPRKPVLLAVLRAGAESTHRRVRLFNTGKDVDVLGNIYAYDPAIGVVNLITALNVGIDHDQLHYDDVLKMAASLKADA